MWVPYETERKHPHDFTVRYRFYSVEEGGRKHLPYQGYRSDFAFVEDLSITPISLRVIHPEFEDENREIILEDSQSVPVSGTARMWILFAASRRERDVKTIKLGMKGYFMEGPKRVAKAEVIEINGLFSNPMNE
ncbi:hypothetical protein [Paenibacillus roseipurpureus]|uniref:Uncharacterized protein n=1 Tax=Paenibacillus roseopurpureus TaxID=2918901 RepID=A0AA96RJY4_9BACL|nr:hypothetical protein [Paenibacillus sp. MBLB1832]WNR43656.1 hypothetical protein MJB10_21525 [Paenibacillus sp. MBLB1832]